MGTETLSLDNDTQAM